MVKIKSESERLFSKKIEKKIINIDRERELDKLCAELKLPRYLGELLVHEVKLTTDSANEILRANINARNL